MAIVALIIPRAGYSAEESVAARVNGIAITAAQVDRAVDDRVPRITGHGAVSESRRRTLRTEVLKELIQEELMVQDAKRLGLSASASAVEAEVAKIRKRFPDAAQYRRALTRAGLSEADIGRGVERYLLAEAAAERAVHAKVSVTDASMRAYYDADPSRFVVPEQAHYRKILIAVDPGGSPAQWEAARRRAAELAKQARGGTPFAELARAHSQDRETRESGGDMGWVHRGQLDHEQEDVVFALAPGEVSDPVRTLYGSTIYFLEARRAPRALSWDDVNKQRLADELRRAETERVRAEWLADLRRRATVEIVSAEP
jgi:parvulin-like peptidyl-prolyl isomerase